MRGHVGLRELLQEVDDIVFTPIVLGELRAGFTGGRRARSNLRQLAQFRESPRARDVAIDDGTAERYAAIVIALRAAGTPIPTNDAWIAASAMQHGLTVVTTDAHYDKVAQVLTERFDLD
jgi:tRNA(fMet)-specific endonuclease VapC